MFKPVPGNTNVLMSLSQEFRDLNGYPIIFDVDEKGRISIELYGKLVKVCPKWLSMISHYEFYLKDPSVDKLFNIDFHSNNIKFFKFVCANFPIFKRPVVYEYEGQSLRVIAAYSRYAISNEGLLVDTFQNQKVNVTKSRSKKGVIMTSYPSVYIYDPDRSMYRYVYIHRLVALAWVKNPDNDFVTRPIVNHINSDKNDYNAKNLEWCSFKHNSQHCYNSGTRNDNIKCKIRDFVTGKVLLFNSKSQAAEYMGIEKSQLNKDGLYLRKGKLIKDQFEFKLQSDTTPWFYENRNDKVKLGRYMISVLNRENEYEYYHDLRDFKKKYSIWNCPNVTEILNRAKKLYPDLKFELTDYYHSEPIQAYKVSTNEIIEDKTIVSISKKTGVPEHIIRRCLVGEETWVYSGYAFRYKKEDSWDKDFKNKDVSKAKPIRAYNLTTKEEIIYPSMRAASRATGIDDRFWFRNCVDQGVEYKGWRFNWVNNKAQ